MKQKGKHIFRIFHFASAILAKNGYDKSFIAALMFQHTRHFSLLAILLLLLLLL